MFLVSSDKRLKVSGARDDGYLVSSNASIGVTTESDIELVMNMVKKYSKSRQIL